MSSPTKQQEQEEEALVKAEEEQFEQFNLLVLDPISLEEAMKLYELYLNGYTTEGIYKIVSDKYTWPQIVEAKFRYDWDKNRKRQVVALHKHVEERIVKARADGVTMIADWIAASKKFTGDKIQKYLVSGDPADLGAIDLSNLKTFKTLVEMLNMLAPAPKPDKDIQVTGVVNHVHQTLPQPSSQNAAKLLEILDAEIVPDPEKK